MTYFCRPSSECTSKSVNYSVLLLKWVHCCPGLVDRRRCIFCFNHVAMAVVSKHTLNQIASMYGYRLYRSVYICMIMYAYMSVDVSTCNVEAQYINPHFCLTCLKYELFIDIFVLSHQSEWWAMSKMKDIIQWDVISAVHSIKLGVIRCLSGSGLHLRKGSSLF